VLTCLAAARKVAAALGAQGGDGGERQPAGSAGTLSDGKAVRFAWVDTAKQVPVYPSTVFCTGNQLSFTSASTRTHLAPRGEDHVALSAESPGEY
jgi:hypothetical protein